jgi:uncharacterized repeat protein (TIGR01451 family)
MKTARFVSFFLLLVVALMVFCLPGVALAQDGEEEAEPTIPESITVSPLYPKVESIAGGTFEFNVEFKYMGTESQVFDIKFTPPVGWEVYMTPRYEKEKKVSSITLKPSFTTGEEFRVVATAPFWPLPEPGEYTIGIEAISDTIRGNADVIAEVTAKYIMQTVPTNERYNTAATAGQDSVYSILLQNLSTAPVENVQFTSNAPNGWSVSFSPDKIDIIEGFDEQSVEVTINPPPKTVAGDYMITLRASGKQIAADEMSIRVTVETPTIWGWVGVAIIVVVVIALIVIFMRFSRR